MIMVTPGEVTRQIITPPAADTLHQGASQTVTGRPQGAGTVTGPLMEDPATACRGALQGAGACWTLTACQAGEQSPVTGAAQGAG